MGHTIDRRGFLGAAAAAGAAGATGLPISGKPALAEAPALPDDQSAAMDVKTEGWVARMAARRRRRAPSFAAAQRMI